MKKALVWLLIMAVPAIVWAYKAPTDYAKISDRVLINAGVEIELLPKLLPDGKVNPDFVKYRNASSWVYLQDKDTFRILIEVNGTLLANPLASGIASCPAGKRQAVLVRTRLQEAAEEPIKPMEIEP